MVRSGGIVSGTFRRVRSDEDVTCRCYGSCQCPCVVCVDDQVLRSISIGEIQHGILILDDYRKTLSQSGFRDFFTWNTFYLYLQFFVYLFEQFLTVADQTDLRILAVLSLRKQICSQEICPCAVVRYDKQLGRSGKHVHRHAILRNDPLRLGNISVSGTENLIHFRDGFRTVSHGCDSLRSADTINVRHPAK